MKRSKVLALVLMFVCTLTGSVLSPFVLIAQNPQTAQDGDVPTDAEQSMFTKGQTLFNQGRYDQAASVLRDLLKSYPNSIIKDLTLLWLGRSYIQLGQLQEAEQAGKSLRGIKDSPFIDIFYNELRTAKREAASRPRNGAVKSPSDSSQNSSFGEALSAGNRDAGATTERAQSDPSIGTAAPAVPTGTSDNAAVGGVIQPGAVAQRSVDDIAKTPASGKQNIPVNQPAYTQPTTQLASNDSTKSAGNGLKYGNRRRRNKAVIQIPPLTGQQGLSNSSKQQSQARGVQATEGGPLSSHGEASPVTSNDSSSNVKTTPESGDSEQPGLSITVRPVAGLVLSLRKAIETALPGQVIQLPLTISNTGTGEDRFRLETDLSAEYQPVFGLADEPATNGLPIFVTPKVARGSSIFLALTIRVPATAPTGKEKPFYVRAVSESDSRVQRITSGSINVLSAGLSAVAAASKDTLNPGETFTQTITFKNEGGATVPNSRLDFVFNPDFELVNSDPATSFDRGSRTAVWSLGDLAASEQRSITVTLRVLSGALSSGGPIGRGIIRSSMMPVQTSFDGPRVSIVGISRVKVEAVSVGLTAKPNDVVYFPFVIRNQGNVREAFDLKIEAEGTPIPVIYADSNRDGKHQLEEPIVSRTEELDPQVGEFPVLVHVEVPATSSDRQKYSYKLVARSALNARSAGEGNSVLTVTMPRLTLRTEQISDPTTPGSEFFYRIVIINEGSGLAKSLIIEEALPAALEATNTEPSAEIGSTNGTVQQLTWRVPELAPGDTLVLRVGARIRSGQRSDANLSTSHTATYQDTRDNIYKTK